MYLKFLSNVGMSLICFKWEILSSFKVHNNRLDPEPP